MPKQKFKLDTSIRKEYLYLVHPENFEKNTESIYKIGRTHDLANRLNVYPSNSIVYRVIRVINCYYAETRLISTFHKNFKHRKDIGKEYFEGNLSDMMECMQVLIDALDQEITDDSTIDDIIKYYGTVHRIYVDGKITDSVTDKPGEQKIKSVRVVNKNRVIRENTKAKYQCKDCGKSFKQKGHYEYHYSNNACKTREYNCSYCGKEFTAKTNMYRHIRTVCTLKDIQNDTNINKDEHIKDLWNEITSLKKEIREIKNERTSNNYIANRNGAKRKIAKVRRS